MEITNEEKIKIMEKMLWDFKAKIVDIDFTIRFNEGEKIKNPNLMQQIGQIRIKLDADRRHAVKLSEKMQREINQLKLKPLEEDLKKHSQQDGGSK